MKWISVTKPGILFGNVVTLVGGFLLGSSSFDLTRLLFAIGGMAFVMASGCVLNNLIDRDIDRLMERTQNRPLAQGALSPQSALFYAALLALAGFALLFRGTTVEAGFFALIGLFIYVVIYSLYFKRASVHGTLFGALAGAIPPVVGYVAAEGTVDLGAFLLFLLLFLWQMPHFYAIGIYRLKDFKAAGLPILPLFKGVAHTKKVMVLYVLAFLLAALLPTLFGYAGWIYFTGALLLGLAWLTLALFGLKAKEDERFARLMFISSLAVITPLSFLMINKS